MVTVAAAKIDQVICRLIDRVVADRYYGLLRSCYRAWIHQKRSLRRSISTVHRAALAGRDLPILPPCCLPSVDLAAARASTPTLQSIVTISHRSVDKSANKLVYFGSGNGDHGCLLPCVASIEVIILFGPALTFSIELADETVTVLSFFTR